jgi:hypothetical protein
MAAGIAAVLPTGAARADHTLAAAKVSLDRYFPRIQTGLGQLHQVRDAIKAGDIAQARSIVQDKTFDIKLRRAMSIYATSFSDS